MGKITYFYKSYLLIHTKFYFFLQKMSVFFPYIINSFFNQQRVIEMKEEMINDLQKDLDKELAKPLRKRDYDKISEITKAIHDISHDDEMIEHENQVKNKFLADYGSRQKEIRVKRRFIAVASCAVIAFGLNIYSFNAWGMNMIDAIYTMQKGGMSIDIHNINDFGRKTIELPTSPDDPYGIKAKCAEYGVYPETPVYIPDGFELKHFEEYEYDTHKTIRFFYRKNGYIWLNITFTDYINYESIPPIGIPTDTYTVHEETINGQLSWVLKEDNQFTDIYIDENNIEYSFFMQSLDYDECYKIVESMCK